MAPATVTRSEKVKQATACIDQHLQELAEEMAQGKSARLVQYLNFCAQFHRYSFGNLILAFSQFPTLTRLAGVKQWNKLGRRIKAGEKGIMILAPMRVQRRQGRGAENEPESEEVEQPVTIMLFKPVYVFDVSQTEGEPLPELIAASGDVSTCYPVLEAAVRAANITVEYVDTIVEVPGAEGISLGGRITMIHQERAEQFRVLAHEFAHELLHKTAEREPHTVRETEADAVAYVVCRHYGVTCDTADYLLLHDSNPKLLLERLETIRQTANRIITAMAGPEHLEEE
jgi:antirestriction protein ArdC